MHIVQYFPGEIPTMGYGGIERVVFWLTRELVKRGFRVTVISAPASRIGVLYPEINFIPLDDEVSDYRSLIPKDADIVHLHQTPNDNRLPEQPYIVTEHGNNRHAKHVQNTVFLSKSHAANHASTHYVYNGIPLEEYAFSAAKNREMLFMAKLGWRVKNAKTAINLAMDCDLPLILTGGDLWAARKIRGSWMLRWPFKKQLIRNPGEVGGSRKLELLQHSLLLFYIVNWAEPFALAPHEALACGTPVLASPNGALAEYIVDGKNGYLVNSYEEARIALEKLLGLSNTQKKQMFAACRESAFSIEDCAAGYLEYYVKIINGALLYTPDELTQLKFTKPKSVAIVKRFG